MRFFLSENLSREKTLLELVQLVGRDGLSEQDKWTLNLSEMFRVVYLQQNAFDNIDAYCSLQKMKGLLKTMRTLNTLVISRLEEGILYDQLSEIPFRTGLLKLRETPDAEFCDVSDAWLERMKDSLNSIEVVVR